MINKTKVLIQLLGCLLLLASCKSKADKTAVIQFSKDSTSIVISNIDLAGYYALEDKYKNKEAFDAIVSVLESPGENDSLAMEKEFPGTVSPEKNTLVFRPAVPFKKGKQYIVSTLVNVSMGGSADMVTKGLNPRGLRTQKTLIR